MDKLREKEERAFVEWWSARGFKLPKNYAMILTMAKKVQEAEEKAVVMREELEVAKRDEIRYREQLHGWLAARGVKL